MSLNFTIDEIVYCGKVLIRYDLKSTMKMYRKKVFLGESEVHLHAAKIKTIM